MFTAFAVLQLFNVMTLIFFLKITYSIFLLQQSPFIIEGQILRTPPSLCETITTDFYLVESPNPFPLQYNHLYVVNITGNSSMVHKKSYPCKHDRIMTNVNTRQCSFAHITCSLCEGMEISFVQPIMQQDSRGFTGSLYTYAICPSVYSGF